MEFWIVLTAIAKSTIATILLFAGVAKLWDHHDFTDVVQKFALLPSLAVKPFAAGLPVAEVMTGIALLVSAMFDWFLVAWAGAAAILLFAIFVLAVSINLVRGKTDISCGCFGKSTHRLTWGLVGRGLSCIAVSVLTLPSTHRATFAGNPLDRVSAALVGIAIMAVIWLGRFVVTSAATGFESS